MIDSLLKEKKYRYLLILPLILFILFSFLSFKVPKSIDLQGGTLIILNAKKDFDVSSLKTKLEEKFALKDLRIIVTKGIKTGVQIQFLNDPDTLALDKELEKIKNADDKTAIELSKAFLDKRNIEYKDSLSREELYNLVKEVISKIKTEKNSDIVSFLEKELDAEKDSLQIREVAPTLGRQFNESAIKTGVWALVFMVIAVFLFFRKLLPSLAVILSAILDLLGALSIMYLFNIPLSLSTIPALLMLIGYSVDTDIMLTTKLMKQGTGSLSNKLKSALKTGLTMTFTTLAALIVMLVVSYLTNITVLYQMSAVLIAGLVIDLISTWVMNAPLLIWYLEVKK